jgi:hypothetical protein
MFIFIMNNIKIKIKINMVNIIVKKNGIDYDYGYSRLLHNGVKWNNTVIYGTSIMKPLSKEIKNYIYKQTLLLI